MKGLAVLGMLLLYTLCSQVRLQIHTQLNKLNNGKQMN